MNYIEVKEENIKFNMPEHLGECSQKEYMLMCRLFFQYQTGKLDLEQFKYVAVYHLLNLKPSKRKLNKQDQEDMQANIYQLSQLVGSFFEEKEEKLYIRQEYQHNPIPVINTGFRKYYGPEDYFNDVVFGQYVDGLNLFGAFHANGDVELLYKLCAIFYKPKGKYYNSKNVDKIANRLKNVDFGYIYGFYMLFASFQHYLTNAAISIEGKPIDLSILFKGGSAENPSGLQGIGMKSTSFTLAETGILGNLRQVENTLMWEVLLLMYKVMKDDKDSKIKAQQQSNNNQQ